MHAPRIRSTSRRSPAPRTYHNDVGTPLLTSDEFVAATVEYVKAYFDAYPYAQTFPVAPGDGFKSDCDDPECRRS